MSYLVLARKWRPKQFSELVGQEHVVRALSNALDSGRVHHAFLFTGTRGVGKTTIARIFAKSLNCERGTSAEPCGVCAACVDIDSGRYIDLLEIDAASNTGVDDVREVIENAQYMPSRGKYKVYLIDEVHMLSRAAFNALLKTLEEPPEHVKFLLATTDPQKLPITVLSRCLQFNLKRLDEAQISGQLNKIVAAEQVEADAGAIAQIAKAADGSMRDGLSLLDQAIAYAGGALRDEVVQAMLGTVDRTRINALLQALAANNGEQLLAEAAALAEFSPNWNDVLDGFAESLHRIQVKQLVPSVVAESAGVEVEVLAAKLRPEVVQLWYQMALMGRRDLHLAPSPRSGFEMTMLRMLAFYPDDGQGGVPVKKVVSDTAIKKDNALTAPLQQQPDETKKPAEPEVAVVSEPERVRSHKAVESVNVHQATRQLADTEGWLGLVAGCQLAGPARELAANVAFVSHEGERLYLSLVAGFEYLRTERSVNELAQALTPGLGVKPVLVIETGGNAQAETLDQRREQERDDRQVAAEAAFMNDPTVQELVEHHGARVVAGSIRPLDE